MTSPFKFEYADTNKTDINVIGLKDSRTGYTVRTAISSLDHQIPSIMAFAGARYSRSDLSAQELFEEIKNSGKNANEKLAAIFRNYGHASVADMAQLFAYIENIPLSYGIKFFYETSVGGGQERSTRYQDFGNSVPTKLEEYNNYWAEKEVDTKSEEYKKIAKKFVFLQKEAIGNYEKYKKLLEKEYIDFFDVDTKKRSNRSALAARVFDSARYFLPNGLNIRTSLAWITSAREWARIISTMKADSDKHLQMLGEQIEELFAPTKTEYDESKYFPEAPDLIKYTSADETTANNLQELKTLLKELDFDKKVKLKPNFKFWDLNVEILDFKYSAGEKVAMQNILCLYPLSDPTTVLKWLSSLKIDDKKKISNVICNGFNHHKQMGNQYRVNEYSFNITMSISEAKDLNRHRAWGRFVPLYSMVDGFDDILNVGYTLPLYLLGDNKLGKIKASFEKDLQGYYKSLKEFVNLAKKTDWFPKELFIQMLPYAHVCRMIMHASPKELSYMSKLRVRPGGHINYRKVGFELARLGAKSDIFINGLAIHKDLDPDPFSREQFLDRS